MAGIAYIYQGQEISFDDPQYNNPQFGTMRMNMKVSGSTVKHGFTSDVSASQYCSLKFKVGDKIVRIGRQLTRSRETTDPAFTEQWSGTGYVSQSGTRTVGYQSTTGYTGSYASRTSSEQYSRMNDLISSKTILLRSLNEQTITGIMTLSSSQSSYETRMTITGSAGGTRTTALDNYIGGVSETLTYYSSGNFMSNETCSFRTGTETQSNYYTNYLETVSNVSSYISMTYGDFEAATIPARTETITGIFETLHNYNV